MDNGLSRPSPGFGIGGEGSGSAFANTPATFTTEILGFTLSEAGESRKIVLDEKAAVFSFDTHVKGEVPKGIPSTRRRGRPYLKTLEVGRVHIPVPAWRKGTKGTTSTDWLPGRSVVRIPLSKLSPELQALIPADTTTASSKKLADAATKVERAKAEALRLAAELLVAQATPTRRNELPELRRGLTASPR